LDKSKDELRQVETAKQPLSMLYSSLTAQTRKDNAGQVTIAAVEQGLSLQGALVGLSSNIEI